MKTVERLYPDAKARRKADAKILNMSDNLPMSAYIAVWLDTYAAIAGERKK